MEKQRLNRLSWYHANKEDIIIDKEARALSQKNWYQKNRERILAEKKASYVPHPREKKYKTYKKQLNKMDMKIRYCKKKFGTRLLFLKKNSILNPEAVNNL